jgi:biotin synthase
MSKVYLCAISNIISGVCNEDCGFCTQSAKHKADIIRYREKDIDVILQEAKKAQEYKAVGFCLVTAGKSLDDDKLDYVCSTAYELKRALPDLNLIACNGTADLDKLRELKKAGIDNYNHNLEASKEFFPNICTTHTWEERYQTCLDAKSAGLNLCSGGIFGLGESISGRISMLKSLQDLDPMSVPINFFHPNPALKIQEEKVETDEALRMIELARKYLPNQMIMVAGGREITFEERWPEIFQYGANAIVIGDYLTTKGNKADQDIAQLEKLGFEIASDCQR